MAALPSLITAATVAYVALFPDDEGRVDSSQALSRSSSRISLFGNSYFSNSFLAGVGVGVSLSWLASYEINRRRLWQRVRLQFLSWLYRTTKGGDKDDGEMTPLVEKFRTPCKLTELNGIPIPRKSESDSDSEAVHGSHLELVSPDWTLSSNLYCDIVTLPPGTELVSKDAEGVEFYYVIKGSGTYVDKDGEKHQISAEYGFIVDPEWYVSAMCMEYWKYCILPFAHSIFSLFVAIEAFSSEEKKKNWFCFVPLILQCVVEIAI